MGGGVAGLSAAHELVRRGYEVEVYEANDALGGKARSQLVPGTGTGGRGDLPGEHGFRFYPAFYRHLIQTMSEIPVDPGDERGPKVADALRACSEAGIAIESKGLMPFLRRRPTKAFDVANVVEMVFGDLGVSPADMGRFGVKVLQYLVSCKERREGEYEKLSWWKYLDGARYSRRFQEYLRSVPRTMVAMDPENGNARTIGNISMQLLHDYGKDGAETDRTLSGPTTERWIAPWRAHLASLGVQFHLGRRVHAIDLDASARAVTGVRLDGRSEPVRADHYVAAVPLEAMVELVTREMADVDPELRKLWRVREKGLADSSRTTFDGSKMTDWMVGAQFFLYDDIPLVKGHVFLPHTPWALTCISQAQFWAEHGRFRKQYGDGSVGGVISVDISNWNARGRFIGKPAKECTRDEILREVWKELVVGINSLGETVLTDDNLHSSHLCTDVEFPVLDRPRNRLPLLVHPPGSWSLRPAVEKVVVANLVLAADYVQTETDLATMEGANEAARRAVNVLLARDRSSAPPCRLWPLVEPAVFDAAKKKDEQRYASGHAPSVIGAIVRDLDQDRADLDDVRRLQWQVMSQS